HGIVILPDRRALSLDGIQLNDVAIDRPPRLDGYSLQTSIRVLLGHLDDPPLAAVPRDGILYITTEEEAGLALETRIYNVRDLLAGIGAAAKRPANGNGGMEGGDDLTSDGEDPFGAGGFDAGGFGSFDAGGLGGVGDEEPGDGGSFSLPPVANQFGGGMGGLGGSRRIAQRAGDQAADQLVRVIVSVTGGAQFDGGWQDIDGEGGTIEHFNGLLAVRQTAAVHRQIEELLAALRSSAGERGWNQAGPAAALLQPQPGKPVVIRLGADGLVTHNGVGLPNELAGQEVARLASERQDSRYRLQVQANVPAKMVQEINSLLKSAGAKSVSVETLAAATAD
ncbi:MAG: hypothetical protein AAF907_18310, partial [Planctomycetota bacterium]